MKKKAENIIIIIFIFIVVLLFIIKREEINPSPFDANYNIGKLFSLEIASEMGSGYNLKEKKESLPSSVAIGYFKKEVKKYHFIIPIEVFEQYYDKIGPDAMVDILDENKFCHSEAHNLGRVIFKHLGDLPKSLVLCGHSCTLGCMHGVFMQLFQNYGHADNLSKNIYSDHVNIEVENLSELISNFCDKSAVKKFIYLGNCYHALGHTLLFISDYNISKGLNYCRLLNGQAPIYYCATGVYMEYSIVSYDEVHQYKFEVYPCNTTQFPAACYRYKIIKLLKAGKNLKEVKNFCLELERPQRLGCFHGIGYAYQYYISNNPKSIKKICSSDNIEDEKVCIDGAIQLIAIYDKNVSISACNYVEEKLIDYCLQEVKYSTFNLNKPLGLYYFDKETKN